MANFPIIQFTEFGWVKLDPSTRKVVWKAQSHHGIEFAQGTATSKEEAVDRAHFEAGEYLKTLEEEVLRLRGQVAAQEKELALYRKAEKLQRIIRHMKVRDAREIDPPGTVQERQRVQRQDRMRDPDRTPKVDEAKREGDATIIMPGQKGTFEEAQQGRDVDERVEIAIAQSDARVAAKVKAQAKARKQQTPREAARRGTHHGYLTGGIK